jgi:tight adherence protein C
MSFEFLKDFQDPWMYLLAGISMGLFTWSIYTIYTDLHDKMTAGLEGRLEETTSFLFRFAVTFGRPLAKIVRPYSERAIKRHQETGIQSLLFVFQAAIDHDLQAAGRPEGLDPDEYMGLFVVSTIVFGVLGYLCYLAYPLPVIIFCFLAAGLLLPRFWLSDRIKQRRKSIRKALPFALDLLTLAVEAGLDFTNSLERIAGKLEGTALGNEFRTLLQEIQMGKVRMDALRDLADRVSVYELSSVISSLVQTDELGAPLGPVLRIQSDFIRVRRSQEAEEMAMKAPVKLLLPLIVFIFPTAFIMIFGPLALKYMAQ